MSDRVQGDAASLVTTAPRPTDSDEGPASPGRPQPLVSEMDGVSAGIPAVPRPSLPRTAPGSAVPRQAVPRPPVPRPPVPRQPAPALVTSRSAAVGPQHVRAVKQPAISRAAVRDELDAALAGAPLSARDKQFLGKLVHWDKRNAASVASLLRRARRAGRNEAALTPVQLDMVLAALKDAVVHRVAGVDSVGCWDCENVRGGRCPEHSRDFERARDYADLAALLSARGGQAHIDGELCSTDLAPTPTPIQPPTDISGYRRRTPIVS